MLIGSVGVMRAPRWNGLRHGVPPWYLLVIEFERERQSEGTVQWIPDLQVSLCACHSGRDDDRGRFARRRISLGVDESRWMDYLNDS